MSLKILSLSAEENTAITREQLLQRAGHRVRSVMDFRELEDALGKTDFNLAIIDDTLRGGARRLVAAKLREFSPNLPILEFCWVSPEVEDAHYILHSDPKVLLAAIKIIEQGGVVKGNA